MYGLENFSRSILFDEEFESALLFLKNAKAIFSVCDVITRKVYYSDNDKLKAYKGTLLWNKRNYWRKLDDSTRGKMSEFLLMIH